MQYTTVNRRAAGEPVPLGMSHSACVFKRVSDVILAIVGLILSAPLWVAIYLALKYQGEGSVIYRQERIGLEAEKDGPRLEEVDDPRLTPVGEFLRIHHLDELPQLWNVLVGDMSMVGYRPERKYFIEQIMQHDARYPYLYQMRPGITSEATLYNGYTNSMEMMLERLNMDLRYLEKGNPWTDVKIMCRTILLVVRGGKTLR